MASHSAEVNIHRLFSKVSSSDMQKIFKILEAMKSDTELYFSIIDNIKENEVFLKKVSTMEGL